MPLPVFVSPSELLVSVPNDLIKTFLAVTAGPGLTNTITAVKNAQMAESPLLLIGGAAPTLLKGRGALQVHSFLLYSTVQFFRTLTRWFSSALFANTWPVLSVFETSFLL